MNMNQPLSDQMEAYLQGMLSTDQESDFLARVEQDPLLKGELSLQKDILEGIRMERRTHLKQRLKNLEVPAAVPQGTSWLRPLGLAAGGAAVVGAILWMATAGEPESRIDTQGQDAKTEQLATAKPATEGQNSSSANTDKASSGKVSPVTAPDHSQAPDQGGVLAEGRRMDNAVKPAEPKDEAADATKDEVVMDQSVAPATVVTKARRIASNRNRKARRATASVDETDAGGMENPDVKAANGQGFAGKGDLSVPTGRIANETETTGKPEVVIKESENLGYQYYDNKLYLYGGFGGELYELIEVHARQEKRLYVYYLDQFYLVRANTKTITALEPIKDSGTTEELERLRKRRVE